MHVNAKAKTSGLVSISVFFSIISLFCISFSINEGKILRSHVCTDRSKLDTLMLYSPIVVVLDIHIVVNGRTRVRYSYLVNGRTRVRRIHVHHALKRGAVKISLGNCIISQAGATVLCTSAYSFSRNGVRGRRGPHIASVPSTSVHG